MDEQEIKEINNWGHHDFSKKLSKKSLIVCPNCRKQVPVKEWIIFERSCDDLNLNCVHQIYRCPFCPISKEFDMAYCEKVFKVINYE